MFKHVFLLSMLKAVVLIIKRYKVNTMLTHILSIALAVGMFFTNRLRLVDSLFGFRLVENQTLVYFELCLHSHLSRAISLNLPVNTQPNYRTCLQMALQHTRVNQFWRDFTHTHRHTNHQPFFW